MPPSPSWSAGARPARPSSPSATRWDERTEAAASIIAGFRVDGYNPGYRPDARRRRSARPMAVPPSARSSTSIRRSPDSSGGWKATRFAARRGVKAIRGTVRTVTPSEIDAYLGRPPAAPAKPVRRRAMPPARPNTPVQLALF